MDRFDDAHVVEGDVEIFVREAHEFSPGEAGAAERCHAVTVGPIDGAEDVRAIAGAADRNQEIAGVGQVFELFDEDAVEAFVVAPGQELGRVIGQAEDAEPFLGVVVEIFPAKRAFAEVLTEMRGIGAATAVADDEDGAVFYIAFVDGVRQGLHLGGIDLAQLLADAIEKLHGCEFDAEHFCGSSFFVPRLALAGPCER